ncbi:hypothetical protein CcI49_29590 [Frankia sp. CcI49]|uniref:hypothetical protein n=1 Tax=unclassified Frankia TaxID=2632575 RepID=UPI0006CA42D3|nr:MULTISPECIES: hypothetical protein [unclassified Frankia]ONH54857.1 hypothetical protein CcI49_29590 [Frankia sp. CcI49]
MARHPVVFALVGAAVLLGCSALLGALDLFAAGAVLGFWVLIAATGLVLGRPGIDWQIPTEQLRRGARAAVAETRHEARTLTRRLAAGRTARRSGRGSGTRPRPAQPGVPDPEDG